MGRVNSRIRHKNQLIWSLYKRLDFQESNPLPLLFLGKILRKRDRFIFGNLCRSILESLSNN
jgi:hypothetical protein